MTSIRFLIYCDEIHVKSTLKSGLCGMRSHKSGSSEIWSDKVKFVYYKAHGVTERTEVMQRYGGADGTKSDGGVAYKLLITILG